MGKPDNTEEIEGALFDFVAALIRDHQNVPDIEFRVAIGLTGLLGQIIANRATNQLAAIEGAGYHARLLGSATGEFFAKKVAAFTPPPGKGLN